MASSVSTKYQNYFQVLGQKRISIVDKYGPVSYLNGTGEVLSVQLFGFNNLEAIYGGLDSTGVYWAAVYKNPGPRGTFTIKWFTFSGMVEVVNTTNLSAIVAQVTAIGY